MVEQANLPDLEIDKEQGEGMGIKGYVSVLIVRLPYAFM